MKKNRFIPYGYTMRNGKMVIEKTEAEVIRRIFSAYIDGASLKEIADELTAQQVPYTEKKTEWFKGRISRILENRKYCCNAEFDKIIDDETFTEAIDAKSARQVAIPGDLDVEITAKEKSTRMGAFLFGGATLFGRAPCVVRKANDARDPVRIRRPKIDKLACQAQGERIFAKGEIPGDHSGAFLFGGAPFSVVPHASCAKHCERNR